MPSWSPDGKKLLYTGRGDGPGKGSRLAVMDADGKNPKQLTTRAGGQMGAWSPDGKKIVYIGGPETNPAKFKPHVYVSKADDSGATQLTKDDGDQGELAPHWSRDGKRIYFNRLVIKQSPEKAGIWVMDADGGHMKALTTGDGMDLLGGVGFLVFDRDREATPRKP